MHVTEGVIGSDDEGGGSVKEGGSFGLECFDLLGVGGCCLGLTGKTFAFVDLAGVDKGHCVKGVSPGEGIRMVVDEAVSGGNEPTGIEVLD